MMRSVEPSPPDAPPPLDAACESAPPLAAALLTAEAALRLGLGLGWLGLGAARLALRAPDGALAEHVAAAAAVLLALCGAATLAGRLPRLAALGGTALLLATPGGAAALLLPTVGAALARIALHGEAAGAWLRAVAARRRELALHLAATELARARAAATRDEAGRDAALHAAGDAYERAGRSRRALEGLGAPDGPAAALAGLAARGFGEALRPLPGLRRRLERWLLGRSERREARTRAAAPALASDT